MLPTIIAIVLGVVLIYVYLASTCFFTQVTFQTAYKLEIEQSGSRKEAVKAGLRVFIGRPPFNVLDQHDIERVSEVFALIPNPIVVAQIIRSIDRSRDASRLKDEDYLGKLEEEYLRIATE